MSFNKNTWSQDYTAAAGIKMLGAQDAARKGLSPKYARKGVKMPPRAVPSKTEGQGK